MISSLFSHLASLAAAHFLECTSHFLLRSLHQAIDFAPNKPSNFVSGHRLRSQQPRSFAAPFWDRTIAFCGPLILIVIVSLFSLLFALFRSLSPGPAAAALVLAVASACCAAASAAAAAARHACCVCVSFFFVIHNADASSTDIDPHASGRSPQTSRICSGAYVATDVSTELE